MLTWWSPPLVIISKKNNDLVSRICFSSFLLLFYIRLVKAYLNLNVSDFEWVILPPPIRRELLLQFEHLYLNSINLTPVIIYCSNKFSSLKIPLRQIINYPSSKFFYSQSLSSPSHFINHYHDSFLKNLTICFILFLHTN